MKLNHNSHKHYLSAVSNIQHIFIALCIAFFSSNVSAEQADENQISEKHLIKRLLEAQHDNDHPVDLKLYVFDCGQMLVRDITILNPALTPGEEIIFSDTCYLISHPNGTLIWDTGLSDSLLGVAGGVDAGNGLFNLSVSKTLKSQLEEIDIDPLSIDYIAFSHLHFDHTANTSYFLNATWLIQEVEYDLAFSPQAEQFFFNPEDYSILQNNDTVKLNGHYDVFGDTSVVIVSTPGHTPGHQVLYLNLAETGPVILSGDLYHFQQNREEYGFPVFNTKKETVHSFALVDDLLDELNAKLWIQHDKPFFDSLNLSPAFYQ
ncbi:hypothetical protein MNBD_GAMMA11-3208 [hydrothermal vent metagenome]|uniref:Metallo-beta-lactamase domain-containing protein n=1 Tax=hydrothermal vent metagenome TaxID=652676 RepID=A0A3B0X5F3_9ZZZZ